MAPKRKAKEAFGQLSAFAAAKQGKQTPNELAATIAEIPYDGPWESTPEPFTEDVPSRPSVRCSTLSSEPAIQSDGSLEVTLKLDESATFVGEFDLEVLSGIVSIHGAMLHSGRHRVYALSSHALPPVVARKHKSKVRISPLTGGIRQLENLSPMFRNLGAREGSFQLLRNTLDDDLKRSLHTMEFDGEAKQMLSRINSRLDAGDRPLRVVAVGPKSSGKSTFNRMLTNTIVTKPAKGKCLWLDLDPGQPEFGPPGQLSLVEVATPLLGPSYTHLAHQASRSWRLIRSHTIAATSFRDDPDHYIACAADLMKHTAKDIPLVINSCGWLSGTGAAICLKLMVSLSVTDAVPLHPIDGELLDDLPKSLTLHPISRRQASPSNRNAAELRTMQTMSFLHHTFKSTGELGWRYKPISTFRPWQVTYSGGHAGIAAVLSYAQAPHVDFLAEVIDGMTLAIVVTDAEGIDIDSIQRTPKEGLPLIVSPETSCSPPLDPRQSECIGLALVRGIDVANKELHLITPLSKSQIANLAKKLVILVRGNFDCPEWAYLEDIHYEDSTGESSEDLQWDSEEVESPWVSRREHVGVEGAVWRLRHPPTRDQLVKSV